MSPSEGKLLVCCIVLALTNIYLPRIGISGLVCPDGKRNIGSTCYKLYAWRDKAWNDARAFCRATRGSDLLIIQNYRVYNDIKRHINQHNKIFWIGANDYRSVKNFKWVDGSSCCSPWWIPGEPNNPREERCVQFLNNGGKIGFNNYKCHERSGFICEYTACREITHCIKRHCSNYDYTVCDTCTYDNVFYKRTHSSTECERMCSFDTHACWPGTCYNGLTSSCTCATEFQAVRSSSQTMCQLKVSTTPTINDCQTIIGGANGEVKRTTTGKCYKLKDFYGNFQPTSLAFEMHSDFSVNIYSLSKNRPRYIAEENFGITDTTIYVKRILVVGTHQTLGTFKQITDVSRSTRATSPVANSGNYALSHPKYTLRNGERLCVKYQAFGGGYMKRKDFRSNAVLSPLPYDKTSSTKTICYRYDDTRPQHCLMSDSCSHGETEPIQIERVSRTSIITVSFTGWIDPIPASGDSSHASGIESYQITVNEVANGIVSTKKVFSKKIGPSNTSLTLNLTSGSPRLYAINLEVKDVADNVQQSRRFVLYDGTTNITSRQDRPFFVISASKLSNYKWQTHHNAICLDWKDHFYNRFYMKNSFLGKKNRDAHGHITGIYEQHTGPLSIYGTPNVFGITQFMFTWSLNDITSQTKVRVPDFLNQSYCHSFSLQDGQTYTLNIEAIDIVNNIFSENRTVHIDRTIPHINNIWLTKNGVKRLFVHDDTDLSKMNLTFEALDPHSGLLNIEWTFGTMDPELQLGSGVIGIAVLEKENCPKNRSNSCYCPDIGKCEDFKYRVPLHKLVPNNTHIGSHNRNYLFTIKVTNKARLSNIEHVDVLVDDLPPERGVVYEGVIGSPDIDYTSDDSFFVRWHGFIDHESGIKEYRLGLADVCLTKKELLNGKINGNISEYTTVLFTESSIRLNAKFTGRKIVSLIGINNAMEASDVACSDGITRDVNPPSIKNVHIDNGKWSESLFCLNGGAWLLRSDIKKLQLSDTDECIKRCTNDTTTRDLNGLLPTVNLSNNDTTISDFLCTFLPMYDTETVIYLPNDQIFLRWDRIESFSQILDYSVGFGHTPTNASTLSIMDYISTEGKQYFHAGHLGIGSGDIFFAHIKAQSKANLEIIFIIGPIMIDETPPYFREKPVVSIDDDSILVGWNKDTIYDLEQTEGINKVLFEIVHDGALASPLLEWRLNDTRPCPRFTGGCFDYPLKQLQRMDTDLGLNFTVRVYPYNNAGHFTLIETDPFSIPSKYPPGHAVVVDTDPEKYTDNSKQDVDVHFTANKVCSSWSDFKHHEHVLIEIGLGTTKTDANVITFRQVNGSNTACIQSKDIQFDTLYFVLLRASCSGGKTLSTSNGISIMNKTYLIQNLNIAIGEHFKEMALIDSISASSSENEKCTPEYVQIGRKYRLSLFNVTENHSLVSKDFVVNDKIYNKHDFQLVLNITPLVKRPCIKIDSNGGEDISVLLSEANVHGFWNGNKRLSVDWNFGLKELLRKLNFRVALLKLSKNTSSIGNITHWKRSSEHTSHIFRVSNYPADRLYTIAVMPCTRVQCLDYALSHYFRIEHAIHPGEILQSTIAIEGDRQCINASISWRQFDALSTVTIYQWSVSRDGEAKTILTSWRTIQSDGRNMYEVNECVSLPVYGHSTLYLCVRAYSAVGNTKTKCQKASTEIEYEYSRNTVYDIDITSNKWGLIKEMLHSMNVRAKISLIHDAELDFGTTDAVVAGVLLHATERNVTWYLMKQRHIPMFADCNQDIDCVNSCTTNTGFVPFNNDIIERNCYHYICAYSNSTSVSRETFTETLQEIRACSNGFVLDDTPPTAGIISMRNTNGFLTNLSSIEITWRGFDDNIDVEEIGYLDRIKYFSYAIGTIIGGTDIRNYTTVGDAQFVDEKDIKFVDGTDVYVTVKAVDQAGLVVTSSSKRLTVDNTPPVTGTVTLNDGLETIEYVSSLVCRVSANGFEDNESSVEHFEVGLGSDEDYEDIISGLVYQNDQFYLKLPDKLHDGHTYYVSVMAVNRANLSAIPVSVPFILDRSPPTGGQVLDGDWKSRKDVDYQISLGYIQGHWNGFTDPHSGIKYYKVGLGTRPQSDDIKHMVNVGLDSDILWNGTYHMGQKYYITIEACNTAKLCRTVSSDGLVLDNSPPIPGIVRVGSGGQHQKYLSQSASVHVHWVGFEDPQSGIDHYDTCLGTRPGVCDILPYSKCLLESSIIKTGLNLITGINLYASVMVYNKAGLNVTSSSDAFQIDKTPPELVQKPSFLLADKSISAEKAQWEKSVLRMSWEFRDEESKIAYHIISLKTHHEGHTPVENIHVGNVDKLTLNLNEKNLLHDGDVYYFVVTSCNVAGLCSSAQSNNQLIDSSPPHQGGFKPPFIWQNFVDSENKMLSRITVNWYGFIDAESSIDAYYFKVSRDYSGDELTQGVVLRNATNMTEEHATLILTEQIRHDDLLILTLWAKNTAGMNSTVLKISVSALVTESGLTSNSTGILEIQKHSCDTHFCNKDCTCAILGKQCAHDETNFTCNVLNKSDIVTLNFPEIDVFCGLPENPQKITASSACLAGHWKIRGSYHMIQRYDWSMGIKNHRVGEGIFDLATEQPWRDVGKAQQIVYCLQLNRRLEHDTDYVIYVRAWYSKNMYGTFTSDYIRVDQTPPHQSKGRFIKDSDNTCFSDFDVINWMDSISACWDGVFTERQGKIIHYTISLGTSVNGSDIFPRKNVGLVKNVTLENLTMSHGTKYFFTVTAYNNVGLQTTVSSDGFVIDMDIPVQGVVFNTNKHTDTGYQSTTDHFNISWHGFLDHYSGIRSYHVAIVEASITDHTNVSFTNVGLKTKHAFRHLKLEHGKHYKGLVKAFDNAGHVSDTAVSNTKMIDNSPPAAYSCKNFEKQKINLTLENDNSVAFTCNMSIHNYYVIVGRFSNMPLEHIPVISIGKYSFNLPVTINSNGSVDFEYSFISSWSGQVELSIEKGYASSTSFALVIDFQLLRCSSLIHSNDDRSAVNLKQIGPSRIAVNCLVMDEESSLYKVHLGAGKTPGGFQIRPLSRLHDSTSSVIDVNLEHGTFVYVTILAQNHAGLRSVFKGYPLKIDKTPPSVSDIVPTVTVNRPDLYSNTKDRTVNVFAQWKAADQESGVKYCLCGLGKTVQGTDIISHRLPDTIQTCLFEKIKLFHGDSAFISIKCINNVEMALSVVSKEITISTTSPDITRASVRIISAGELLKMKSSSTPNDQLVTYAQTDISRIQMEWQGFQDPSGLTNYEYRIMSDNNTVVDWKATEGETMADVKGLSLDFGKVYIVEIRAINSGTYASGPVVAGVSVHHKPTLTGESASFVRNNKHLAIDWSNVFVLDRSLQVTYDVTIGTRFGSSDVIELRRIELSRYEFLMPKSTIVTPNISAFFISITCTYSNELFTVYDANFKL